MWTGVVGVVEDVGVAWIWGGAECRIFWGSGIAGCHCRVGLRVTGTRITWTDSVCGCDGGGAVRLSDVRIIVADCSAQYSGRLNASLPLAKRVLLVKADNSVLIFSELGSYKPLNWMAAPCTIRQIDPPDADDDPDTPVPERVLRVCAEKSDDVLEITLQHVYADDTYDLGEDPGLVKDGVEDHLQRYLAEQIERIGEGAKLVRREYPTAIGPVDIMAVDGDGTHVAIEIKRHGEIDGVEQLTRYCKLLNRDPLIAPVRGIFAAQTITPQARTLAHERGFECMILDYDDMKGQEDGTLRLF